MSVARKPSFPYLATILMLVGVVILCALGTWQLQRLSWKNNFIEQLDRAYAGERTQALDLNTEFSFGQVQGFFLSDEAVLVGPRTRDGEIGAHVIVPLAIDGGHTLFVNLGWSDADDVKAFEKLFRPAQAQSISFSGLLRASDWNSFTPENVPESDVWYRADPIDIANAKGLVKPVPYILYAERASYDFDGVFPNNERHYPNNNHMQYAFFWFSLAGVLFVIYVLRFLRS